MTCMLDERQHAALDKMLARDLRRTSKCRPARLRTKVRWFIMDHLRRN